MHIYHHLWNSRSFLLAPSYNTSYCQAPHPTPPPLFHQHMANIIWVTETGRKYFMISPYCIYTCWSLIFSWEKKILALLRVEPLPTAWTGGVVLVPVRCTSPTAPWWEHRFCRDMIWLGTDDIITIVARHYRLEIDTMRAPTHATSWSIHATHCMSCIYAWYPNPPAVRSWLCFGFHLDRIPRSGRSFNSWSLWGGLLGCQNVHDRCCACMPTERPADTPNNMLNSAIGS